MGGLLQLQQHRSRCRTDPGAAQSDVMYGHCMYCPGRTYGPTKPQHCCSTSHAVHGRPTVPATSTLCASSAVCTAAPAARPVRPARPARPDRANHRNKQAKICSQQRGRVSQGRTRTHTCSHLLALPISAAARATHRPLSSHAGANSIANGCSG